MVEAKLDRAQWKTDEKSDVVLEKDTTLELWEADDAPAGSTSESLLYYENGLPVRVSGPTHFHHLADGSVVGGYGIGTHHTDVDGSVTPITATYGG